MDDHKTTHTFSGMERSSDAVHKLLQYLVASSRTNAVPGAEIATEVRCRAGKPGLVDGPG